VSSHVCTRVARTRVRKDLLIMVFGIDGMTMKLVRCDIIETAKAISSEYTSNDYCSFSASIIGREVRSE
jgi:hypothetical protein